MLHELLTRSRDDIVSRCERRYREHHPTWSHDDLLVMIPRFVDEIIKAERREAGIQEESKLPGDTEEARLQGEHRFRKGSRIRDVAADFAAISQVIGEIAIEQGVELDARSYKVLNECLDAGVAQSIDTYFTLSVQKENRETAQTVGFLAHELRNAVSSAVIAYDFIRTGRIGADSRTARVLERSLNQLEALVAQMLAEVQLKSGTPLAVQAIALRDLVEDISAGALLERHIRVEIDIDASIVVAADPRLLASAVSNLLQNALKFTRTDGTIQIRAARTATEITIEVEDECGGLPAAPEAMFVPFEQNGSKPRGLGLGLSITRQAIEAHGGTISARDVRGKGCVFTIHLPLAT